MHDTVCKESEESQIVRSGIRLNSDVADDARTGILAKSATELANRVVHPGRQYACSRNGAFHAPELKW
jgi:hypothetical protein